MSNEFVKLSDPLRPEAKPGHLSDWALLPVLATQGLWVRRRTPRLPPAQGLTKGSVGSGAPINLLALGDSIIAGVGVQLTHQALPGQLAATLARRGGLTVHWHSLGRNGANTEKLHGMVRESFQGSRDIQAIVISNGINDVTSTRPVDEVMDGVRRLFADLNQRFPRAVLYQLGLPPLGAFPALPRPLRTALGRRSKLFDSAIQKVITEIGYAYYLPFTRIPEPQEFAADGYHPAESAVRDWAGSLAEMMLHHAHWVSPGECHE